MIDHFIEIYNKKSMNKTSSQKYYSSAVVEEMIDMRNLCYKHRFDKKAHSVLFKKIDDKESDLKKDLTQQKAIFVARDIVKKILKGEKLK